MMTLICQYLRNWFDRYQPKFSGHFEISNGAIELDLKDGQFYRIMGSALNDGVHQYGSQLDSLLDEEFDGIIWGMAVPPDVITLASDIEAWVTANQDAINSPYASESFGGYSYTKNISVTNAGNSTAWQSQFAARLNPWRKI